MFDKVPDQVVSLSIGKIMNGSKNLVFPSTITTLELTNVFKQLLSPGVLPSTIKTLKLGKYNHKIIAGVIPDSVEILKFGDDFKQRILPGVLPSSIKRLTFGKKYNKILYEGSIPPRVKYLNLGEEYHHTLKIGIIPPSVKYIRMNKFYRQKTINLDAFPLSIDSLSKKTKVRYYLYKRVSALDSDGYIPKHQGLPWFLTHLTIGEIKSFSFFDEFKRHGLNILPPSLRKLYLYDCSLDILGPLLKNSNVKKLIMVSFDARITPSTFESVSHTVKKLDIYDYKNTIEPNSIPTHIKTLALRSKTITKSFLFFNQRTVPNGVIPSTIEFLKIGQHFQQHLVDLPHSIKKLTLGGGQMEQIEIPPSVIKLKIKCEAESKSQDYNNFQFPFHLIPATVQHLKVNLKWIKNLKVLTVLNSIVNGSLKSNLKTIRIYYCSDLLYSLQRFDKNSIFILKHDGTSKFLSSK
eukprot:gene4916-6127_t